MPPLSSIMFGKDLIACTYNCQSVNSDDRLSALIHEAQRIKYHVIGLSETRRKEPLSCTWKDGTLVFLGARKTDSTSGGVGFIVSPDFSRYVQSVEFHGDRLATITASLSENYPLTIIQAYAPTANSNKEEHDTFYGQLVKLKNRERGVVIVMGDFNTLITRRKENKDSKRPFSYDESNEVAKRLARFWKSHFYHGNSRFLKDPAESWTYVHPRERSCHEFDHILCSHEIMKDVAVVPSFNMGNDHRLLQGKFSFGNEMRWLYATQRTVPCQNAIECPAKCPLEVDDINGAYYRLVQTVSSVLSVASNQNSSRISASTCDLLKQRKLVVAAENWESLKKAKKEVAEYQLRISCLKNANGDRYCSIPEMEKIIATFYSSLFKSNLPAANKRGQVTEKELPFTSSDVQYAVESMPRGTKPGEDGISLESLRAQGEPFYQELATLYTQCLTECQVPRMWKQYLTVLRFKQGDKEDLANYHPSTTSPLLYKVFTRCILERIRTTLEKEQPVEQAGSRLKFSPLDHIVTCRRLIEAFREHRLPLVLTFITYKNVFDSVEPVKVWEALEEQGVEKIYVDVLRESYSERNTVFRPFYNDVHVAVGKGLRQDDPVSPHLLSACLEHVIRRCNWYNYGVNIDGRRLNQLRFGSNIVLITNSPEDATEMLRRLDEEGSQCGLSIDTSKTKVMRNSFSSSDPVLLKESPIEDVDGYVYLGSQLNMRSDLTGEIKRGCEAAEAAFESIKTMVEDTKNDNHRVDLFNLKLLPALTYALETCTLTPILEKKLMSTQTSLALRLLGLRSSRQKKLSLDESMVRAMLKVKDVLHHIHEAKFRLDSYLKETNDVRWSSPTVQWYPLMNGEVLIDN